jgi:hypothetical protein
MKRETIVRFVQRRDPVVAWTASDLDHYWAYRPKKDSVELVAATTPLPIAVKKIADEEGCGGVWVRGRAGMSVLYPVFAGLPRYWCRDCKDMHDSDEISEWLLLGNVDRLITDAQLRELPFRLRHPKRSNAAA